VLGWGGVALSDRGIRYATLVDPSRDEIVAQLAALGALEREDPRTPDIAAAFHAWSHGQADALDHYPVDLADGTTALQAKVWLGLRTIPAGETRSYGWLGRLAGQPPSAARVIGQLVGSNPVCLWLPCHRVIASDGTLHGFGGGLPMKQAILELEGALPKRMLL
jgi:methylated-DNA-[protein]-cysteine S-methyltransferase